MRLVETDAAETRTAAVYSGWREYHGEATIRFDDTAASGEVQAAAPTRPLPAGLSLSLELTSPIDTDTVAAGDVVTAKLSKPVRNSKKVLVPAGAVVQARVVQMQHWLIEPRHFAICLMLELLRVGGVATRLYGGLRPKAGSTNKDIDLPPPGQCVAFVFRTNESRYIVAAGYQSSWVTGEPPPKEKK